MAKKTSNEARGRAPKYLTFEVHGVVYGVEILSVQEIIRMMEITPIPGSPRCMRGVINLRGEIISVVDLRARFGLPEGEDTNLTHIIVLEVSGENGTTVTRGVVVDRVIDVLTIPAERLEPPPCTAERPEDDFVRCIGKTDTEVVVILDTRNILQLAAPAPVAAA